MEVCTYVKSSYRDLTEAIVTRQAWMFMTKALVVSPRINNN